VVEIEKCIDLESISVEDGGIFKRVLHADLLVEGLCYPEIDYRVRDVAEHFVGYLNDRGDCASFRGHTGLYNVSHTRDGRYSEYTVDKVFCIEGKGMAQVSIMPRRDADLDVISDYAAHIKQAGSGD